MSVFHCATAGQGAGDLLALLTALPVLGVLGGLAAGGLTYRLSRRAEVILGIAGAAALGVLIVVSLAWVGATRAEGMFLGEGLFRSYLVLSAARLQAILVLSMAAVLAVLLARWEGRAIGCNLLFGIPWTWGIAVWVTLLSNGPLRAWGLAILAVSLFVVAVPGYCAVWKARRLLFCVCPLAVSSLIWFIGSIATPAAAWPRQAAALVWLFALPLPGLLVLWVEGTCAGLLVCQVFAGTVALLVLGDGVVLPVGAILVGMTALIAGIGSVATSDVRRFAFLACSGLLAQGVATALAGAGGLALRFMVFFLLLTFGLWAAVVAAGPTPMDVRFRKAVPLPRWARWVLGLALVTGFGGAMPGGVLGLRALTLGRLEAGGSLDRFVLGCLLIGTFFTVLGVLRFLSTCWENGRAPVPAPLLGGFAALILAMVNPFSLDIWGGRAVAHEGFRFPWILLVPIAGALLAHGLAPPPEGVARLWSGVRPSRDRAILSLTGHGAISRILGGLGAAVLSVDRLLFWLFGVLWIIVRSVGSVVRLLERCLGAVAAGLALWRLVA